MTKGRRYKPGDLWKDPRRDGVDYTYRFQLKEPTNTYAEIRAAALTVMRTMEFKPLRSSHRALTHLVRDVSERYEIGRRLQHLVPGTEIVLYDHKRSTDDHISTLVVHGGGQLTIVLEHDLMNLEREFCIAHELGHYVLHAEAGRKPVVFPRKSIGRHDCEAVIFAAVMCLGEQETDLANTAAGRSILGTAVLLSRKFKHLRLAAPAPKPAKKKRRRTKREIYPDD